ncbi:MAG TPA: ADOP family duplicated permease [Acidobacteriota bacterium]|nr:ADOP family duplicated permease [Acidobacteriota bacterium]
MKVRLKHWRLAQELRRRGISQNRWAQILGVSKGHLSMLVNGRRPFPSPATRRRLLKRLDLEFDELFVVVDARGRRLAGRFTDPRRGHNPSPWWRRKGEGWMQGLLRDLRYAVRTLGRQPGFALAAVLTLALAIAANTVIFSVVDAALLRPLAYPDGERLVRLWEGETDLDDGRRTSSLINIEDWRSMNRVFEDVAAYDARTVTYRGGEHPERLPAAVVTDGFFELLGVTPLRGRLFNPDEDSPQADPVVIVSWTFLQTRLQGDAESALGRTLTLGSTQYTVVGVLPRDFEDPALSGTGAPAVLIWLPLRDDRARHFRDGRSTDAAIARLRAGVSWEQVREDLSRMDRILTERFPQENTGYDIRAASLRNEIVGEFGQASWVLTVAVGLLLAIACVNVANLCLGRGASRRREFALRLALGASRGRVVRQQLAETTLLGLAGGAVGLVLAWGGLSLLLETAADRIPRAREVSLDGRVLLFTLAVSLSAGLLFGLAPVLQARRGRLRDDLAQARSGSAGTRMRSRFWLITAETALALVVLTSAAFLSQSFYRLLSVDLGFETQRRLSLTVTPDFREYGEKPELEPLYQRIRQRLEALPGVEAVSDINRVPLGDGYSCDGFGVIGRPRPKPGQEICAETRAASPGYLEVMGLPLLRGRDLLPSDNAEAPPVMLINQTLAERLFPDQDPLEHQIWIHEIPRQIVGVYADARVFGPLEEVQMEILLDWRQDSWASWNRRFVLRTSSDPSALAEAAREAVWAISPQSSISDLSTFDQLYSQSLSAPRLRTVLMGLFATASLLLACIGIAGVLSYLVSRRVSEIGVRKALGARPKDITSQVLGEILRPVLTGVGLGAIAAVPFVQYLRGFLYEVSPFAPLPFLAAALLLVVAAVAGSVIPARRAARLDPLLALRSE